MAQDSGIEWTESTWNPVAGCTPVSPGCLHCYAARMALRLEHMNPSGKYAGTSKVRNGLPVFTGRINCDEEALDLPRRWRRPRLVFVNSMSDLFHDAVPESFIVRVFDVMRACQHHTFQVLTKRPERAAELAGRLEWAPNIWMGTSVEAPKYFERIHTLRSIPAKIRFLSCEPLLSPLPYLPLDGIHWVIVGGESGPGARPIRANWVTQIRDRCIHAGIPFFFKQWGGTRKSVSGRTLEGQIWDELPHRGENGFVQVR